MTSARIKIKEEPPDEELSAILDNEIQLSSIDKDSEGLITKQIEEILPNDDESYSEEEEDEEEDYEKPKKKLPCHICDFKAKTKQELKRHEGRHAIKGWYHECKYCDYVTYIRQRLQEHEAKHTNSKPFKCEKCDFKTRFKADLYKHRAKHSTVKKFSCPQCDFRTKWCRNIKHHLLKHTEERPHGCNICGFRFKRIQDLKYHLYRHNDVKPIQCEECDFRCKTNYELKCHRLKHSDIKNFSCTYPGCKQRTKTKSDLTKHMRTHNKDNNYLCSICGKGFNTATSLNKHKDRHSNVRKFKCGLCEKWFKNKPSLRAHMKIHSGVKPFQCDVCLRNFLNKYNMQKHKETHEGDRPYLCPICPYGARISDHLLAHIGSMHGDSHAYFCELCRKPFKRYSQLQVHIKRMHKDVQNFDRNKDGKIDIKLESDADGVISTGNDVFSVKKIGDCHFEPEVKRKRGRPPKVKVQSPGGTICKSPVQDCKGVENLETIKIKVEDQNSESSSKLATYQDGFRLPLATKGFQFNFDKTGKKPRSWFMQPENMYGNAAAKQRAYIAKKERYFDRMHSGRIPRVRKKSDVAGKDIKVLTNGITESELKEDKNHECIQEKKLEPHRLLVSGRSKLKTMRKIKRRIRNIKESMKGSPLLENLAQTSTGGASRWDQKENTDVEVIQGMPREDEDEDDIPLSKLKVNDSQCKIVGEDSLGCQPSETGIPESKEEKANMSSCENAESSCELDNENGSHIKLVLKRKRRGTFKVTLNTSKNMPDIQSAQNQCTVKKLPNLVSDVYNGSVRILGKSLQCKSKALSSHEKLPISSLPSDENQDKTKTVGQNKQREKQKDSCVKMLHSNTSAKERIDENNGKKKKVIRKASNKQQLSKNQSGPNWKASQSDRKPKQAQKSKPKKSKTKSKQTKPKFQSKSKRKKKNLVCSIGKRSNKTSTGNVDQGSMTQRFLQQTAYEDFPIKIEPADDGYESSYKSPMSGGQVLEAMSLSTGTYMKMEPEIPYMDHQPSCPGSSECTCEIKKEPTEDAEPSCRYLYGLKNDETVVDSYNEHAIAWGLKVNSQRETPSVASDACMLKFTSEKNIQPSISQSSSIALSQQGVTVSAENRSHNGSHTDESFHPTKSNHLQQNSTTSILESVSDKTSGCTETADGFSSTMVYCSRSGKDMRDCSATLPELSPLDLSQASNIRSINFTENGNSHSSSKILQKNENPVSYVYTF